MTTETSTFVYIVPFIHRKSSTNLVLRGDFGGNFLMYWGGYGTKIFILEVLLF